MLIIPNKKVVKLNLHLKHEIWEKWCTKVFISDDKFPSKEQIVSKAPFYYSALFSLYGIFCIIF